MCRSKSNTEEGSLRSELFTIAKRGIVTVVNNSDQVLYPGDLVGWTFEKIGKIPANGGPLQKNTRNVP